MGNEKGTYIIAECACEHGGKVDYAKDMIDDAKYAGADCVKFQLFYEEEVGAKIWEQIKQYALSIEYINTLHAYAMYVGIDFLVSPFGLRSQKDLADIALKRIKVPAPCNEWKEYFIQARERFSHLIISSGMTEKYSSLWHPEVDDVLLCTSAYPCPYSEVNLRRLYTMYSGISDHTLGDHVAIAAVALGAKIVEKHMTGSHLLCRGPDHDTSLTPKEFYQMVKKIRDIEDALGNPFQIIQPSERKLLCRKTY